MKTESSFPMDATYDACEVTGEIGFAEECFEALRGGGVIAADHRKVNTAERTADAGSNPVPRSNSIPGQIEGRAA